MTASSGAEAALHQLGGMIELLGYAEDPNFVRVTDTLEASMLRHPLEVAFDRMGVIGALCLPAPLAGEPIAQSTGRRLPVVYVLYAKDLEAARMQHRAVWSQSIVPQIIIGTPDGFQVCNGFDYRSSGRLHSWSELSENVLPAALTPLTANAVRSSASWRDFAIEDRVDARIGRDIRNLSAKVRGQHEPLRTRPDVVNALIGHLLYLYILVDRRIISQDWVDAIVDEDGARLCSTIMLSEGYGAGAQLPQRWPIIEVWHMFDAIDDVLNGSVFPIEHNDRQLVNSETLHLIRRVLRSDDLDEKGHQQYAFVDIDYSTLRTETISAVYECFFELEGDGERKRHGAYYTPPFLVDYVVQEADRIRPLNSETKVVDPACGSGAFLVVSYRHILERVRASRGDLDAATLRRILVECIWGIELKKQAANVARFSLYLTMLDYLPGVTISSIGKRLDSERLFPDLKANIVCQDAFDDLPTGFQRTATHVLGNPPWSRAKADTPASSYARTLTGLMQDTVIDQDASAELFYWRAVNDICAEEGMIAFVMPTKGFIAPSAKHFPHGVATRTRIHGLANLTSFRRKLFQEAGEAATVIFASARAPVASDSGWRFSPRLSSQPLGADGRPWAIVVDRGDVERFHQAELRAEGHEWYRDLLLAPLDRRLVSALEASGPTKSLPTVATFLACSRMHVSTGETFERTGLPEKYVLGTSGQNDYRTRLGLNEQQTEWLETRASGGAYSIPDELFEGLSKRLQMMFGGPTLLMPRSQAPAAIIGRAAYNASIQGVYFTDGTVPEACKLMVLREFASYLRTAVGRYLISIFGRSWIADQRRLETPDLKRLPFPYSDHFDLLDRPISCFKSASGFDERGFAEFAADRFGMPPVFVHAVLEHQKLRERFQNGKRANGPISEVVVDDLQIYEAAIRDELRQLLADTPLEVRVCEPTQGRRQVQIVLAPDPAEVTSDHRAMHPPEFGSDASIDMQDHEGFAIARISKPNAPIAWTAERAYADAIGIARMIMAG